MAEDSKHPTRDEIRGAIFATKKLAKEEVEFFGQKIELRQPRLSDVISIQNAAKEGGTQSAIVEALIKYAFIPGTDEHLFEEADTAEFLQMPFGQDLINVADALERLSKVNFRSGSASSDKTQASS